MNTVVSNKVSQMSNLRCKREKMVSSIRNQGYKIKIWHVNLNSSSPVLFDNDQLNPSHPKSFSKKLEEEFSGEFIYARKARGYTIAVIEKNGNTFVGRAICSSQDMFNKHQGAIKAIGRACGVAGLRI